MGAGDTFLRIRNLFWKASLSKIVVRGVTFLKFDLYDPKPLETHDRISIPNINGI